MQRTKLRETRMALKMTQQEVADHAHVRRSYYGLVETGARNPSFENAQRIAEALGLRVEDAFENDLFFAGRCYESKRISV